jgi:hypothetical protein
LLIGAIAPVAALAAYLPAIVVPYAYMDDYFVLAWREGLGGDFFRTATSFGRPLHGFSLWGVFSLATDPESLRLVRLLALVGVMLLAVLLYYALRQAQVNEWVAAGACVSVVTLAAFQVYVAWASAAEVPYVAALGGLAWLTLRSGVGLQARVLAIRCAAAAGLLLLALLTYQPAAMFFWVFAAIDALRPAETLRGAARKLGLGLGVAAVAMFFAYVAVRIGVHFYGGANSGRTNLVHDFVAKARWFWNEPIVNSFGMFGLVPTASITLAIAIVAAAGIVLLHLELGRASVGFLGLAVALVPLSYAPNLAVSEQFASYRSIGALSALLALYVWLGLWGIARALGGYALAASVAFLTLVLIVRPIWRPAARVSIDALTHGPELGALVLLLACGAAIAFWSPRGALAAGVICFAVAATIVAARNVTTLFVKPQSIELQMLRSDLASPPTRKRVVFVKPNWNQGPAPLARYDEFGLPSTYFAWVPGPATQLLLGERHPKLDILAWDEPDTNAGPGDSFVDMRKLDQRNVAWTVWTFSAAGPSSARRP